MSLKGFGQNIFQTSLLNYQNLLYDSHYVEMTNQPTVPSLDYLDLDFVQIERSVGQEKYVTPHRDAAISTANIIIVTAFPLNEHSSDKIYESIVDSTSPFVEYSQGIWQSLQDPTSGNNGMLQRSESPNSKFTIKFQGCCIVRV